MKLPFRFSAEKSWFHFDESYFTPRLLPRVFAGHVEVDRGLYDLDDPFDHIAWIGLDWWRVGLVIYLEW